MTDPAGDFCSACWRRYWTDRPIISALWGQRMYNVCPDCAPKYRTFEWVSAGWEWLCQ